MLLRFAASKVTEGDALIIKQLALDSDEEDNFYNYWISRKCDIFNIYKV